MPRPKKETTETKKTPETKKKDAVTKAVKAAVVKEVVEKAADAKKEKVKKEVTKKVAKTAVKKVAEKAVEKKVAEKKTATKKAAPAKKPAKETARTNVILQYGGMNVTYDDLIQNAKNKYQYDMGGDTKGIKNLDLYVKPDEGKVYFVINKKIEGDYDL